MNIARPIRTATTVDRGEDMAILSGKKPMRKVTAKLSHRLAPMKPHISALRFWKTVMPNKNRPVATANQRMTSV